MVLTIIISKTRTKRLFFFLLFTIPASAQTTYYISNAGNDANNGISTTTSWKTPMKIFAHGTFNAGDSILFKRGDVFAGFIRSTMQGTVNSPIVIGAYSSGKKPVIYGDCRELVWTPIPGRTGYYKAVASDYQLPYNNFCTYFYQWVNGAWSKSSVLTSRGSNPSTWPAWFDALGEGHFGNSVYHDTLFLHTFGNVVFPTSRDSIRVYRNANYLLDPSYNVIVRDLDLRCYGSVGFETKPNTTPIGFSNITYRNLSAKNNLTCNLRLYYTTNGMIDSCYADTVGGTNLYLFCNTRTKVCYNTVLNVLTTVDGIPCAGDLCGIGTQGSPCNHFDYTGYGWNTIEYNKLYNTHSSFIDFYWNRGDTVRYNEGHGASSGNPCHGTNIVIDHNSFTFYTTGGNGANLSNKGNGTVTFTNNILDSVGANYAIMTAHNDSAGGYIINHNTIKGVTTGTFINFEKTPRITSTYNKFIGTSGKFIDSLVTPKSYTDLTAFQAAAGYESGSTLNGLGSTKGTFTVNPSLLSFGNVLINTSSQSSFTVSGSDFTTATGDITITAPTGYTVSKTSGGSYTSSLTCAYTNNTLPTTTIYVLFSPTALQSYTGNITIAGGGATTQNVAATGTGISATTPTLTINPTSLSFGNVTINTISSELTFTLTGLNLSPAVDSLTIAAPSGFTISTVSGSGFTASKKIPYTSGTLLPKIIYVRFSPTAVQSYSDSITNGGGSAVTKNMLVSGNGLSDYSPPTGTFIASSDTLPASGGSVTLTWTSPNASSASINNGIGTVATNGFITRIIRATARFTLTLSNINGNTSYIKKVYVKPRKLSRNKALGMPSTASTVELTGVEAPKANDGDASTRWSSAYSDNQWWQVDLQNISTIDHVTLTWDSSFASQFTISTSLDGLLFTDAVTGYASGPDTIELNFDPVSARYVRLTGIQRGTQFGISFFELGVYESLITSVESPLEAPRGFSLEQNFPNPFNPSTEIGYQLTKTAEVQLIVYNIIGKEIVTLVNQVQQAGHHTLTFNANNLASGMYYARLKAEGKVQIRKMLLTK